MRNRMVSVLNRVVNERELAMQGLADTPLPRSIARATVASANMGSSKTTTNATDASTTTNATRVQDGGWEACYRNSRLATLSSMQVHMLCQRHMLSC
eukprot:7011877-Pyramimonas_sp.AAC.1